MNGYPKEKQFRAVMFQNTGQEREGVPIFDEPVQVDLEFPHGSMVFGDIDDDGVLDLVTVAQRWNVFDGKECWDRNEVVARTAA